MAVDSCAVNTQGSASPAGDPLAILDSLAAHTDAAITAFAPLPPNLSPLDVEIACIHILNGSIRTITNLARLREQAADTPESHAFDEPIARLEAIAAHNQARLHELETRRQPTQIPWRQQQQLQLRYQAVAERIYLLQGKLQRQAEIAQERRQQRAQKTRSPALRQHLRQASLLAEHQREPDTEISQAHSTYSFPIVTPFTGNGMPDGAPNGHHTTGATPDPADIAGQTPMRADSIPVAWLSTTPLALDPPAATSDPASPPPPPGSPTRLTTAIIQKGANRATPRASGKRNHQSKKGGKKAASHRKRR